MVKSLFTKNENLSLVYHTKGLAFGREPITERYDIMNTLLAMQWNGNRNAYLLSMPLCARSLKSCSPQTSNSPSYREKFQGSNGSLQTCDMSPTNRNHEYNTPIDLLGTLECSESTYFWKQNFLTCRDRYKGLRLAREWTSAHGSVQTSGLDSDRFGWIPYQSRGCYTWIR